MRRLEGIPGTGAAETIARIKSLRSLFPLETGFAAVGCQYQGANGLRPQPSNRASGAQDQAPGPGQVMAAGSKSTTACFEDQFLFPPQVALVTGSSPSQRASRTSLPHVSSLGPRIEGYAILLAEPISQIRARRGRHLRNGLG